MENLSVLGFVLAAILGGWTINSMGLGGVFFNTHGLVVVLGGVFCAALVNYPVSQFVRAAAVLRGLLLPVALPSLQEVSAEIMRLAQVAKTQGGILALQNEGREFAGGFLNRALIVAIAAHDQVKAREILESEIRQTRIVAQEDANFFRTLGTLAPMFGLLGTLLGIILVLRNMTDPIKVGPSMALAITASLYGIAFSNLFCIPIAGQIRTRAVQETRVQEAIVVGVLELMQPESLYLLELQLGSYSQQTTPQLAAPGAANT